MSMNVGELIDLLEGKPYDTEVYFRMNGDYDGEIFWEVDRVYVDSDDDVILEEL
jgi:hypothetical protein